MAPWPTAAASRSPDAPHNNPADTPHTRCDDPGRIGETAAMQRIELLPIEGIPEVRPGDVLATLIMDAADPEPGLRNGDVIVVTQKVVSKAENRLVPVDPDIVDDHKRYVLSESVRILRRRPTPRGELIISETTHGFICANAGIDLSNVDSGYAALLPVDSDRSARKIRDGIRGRLGIDVGVIISDTFGRPWRKGLTDVAIGCAGVAAVVDLRGTEDAKGRELHVTEVCVADELASAAELVMGKATGVAAAIVRGVNPLWLREGSVRDEIVRPASEDLFR
jgi:coenzyme F420-0:L-glutamate ligase / coenzyme F420-1:gamma-L-glutamate ligase